MSKNVTVYPVDRHFIQGVPDIETTTDQKSADALVATGAFTYDPPPKPETSQAPEGPASAGPSDSTEE